MIADNDCDEFLARLVAIQAAAIKAGVLTVVNIDNAQYTLTLFDDNKTNVILTSSSSETTLSGVEQWLADIAADPTSVGNHHGRTLAQSIFDRLSPEEKVAWAKFGSEIVASKDFVGMQGHS